MRYTGIHHVALVTRDMDATLRFWRDLLCMELVAGLGREGTRQFFLRVSERDRLTFFEWPKAEPVEEKDHGMPVAGPVVFDHLSFGVESRDLLWELKSRLEAGGFWASEVIDHGFFHSLYSFDPNGAPIEFTWEDPEAHLESRQFFAEAAHTKGSLEGRAPVPERWPPPCEVSDEDRLVFPGEGSELSLRPKPPDPLGRDRKKS